MAFRQLVDGSNFDDFEYEPGEHGFVQELFGCDISRGGVQDVGAVEIREGRMITFPNLLLQQLQPFELEDASRAGHLGVLQLFLVDPTVRIVGTADVPAQQLHWWREELVSHSPDPANRALRSLSKLPAELKDRIFDCVDNFPISLEEAKGFRMELLAERQQYTRDHASTVDDCNRFYLV